MSVRVKMVATVPQLEHEICLRLRGIRLAQKWNQPDFAAEFGISRTRLASYEYGRAPVRYGLGSIVCRRFQISQRWLATGRAPMLIFSPVPIEIERKLQSRQLFSEAYQTALRPIVEEHLHGLAEKLQCEVSELDAKFAAVSNAQGSAADWKVLHAAISQFMVPMTLGIPPALQQDFYSAVTNAAVQFMTRNEDLFDEYWSRERPAKPKGKQSLLCKKQNNPLQGSGGSLTSSEMQIPSLPELLAELKTKTAKRGKKSELAAHLGVNLASLSLWLSGHREPGGEATLKLLKWVKRPQG